jgi:hypothetical protein
VSPSGKGLKGLVRIPSSLIKSDVDFKRIFPHIEAMFANGL